MKEFEVFRGASPECRRIRRLLDDFLAQELSVESSQEILGHLESCQACRTEEKARRRLLAQLRAEWNAPAAPTALKARVEREIDSPFRYFSGGSALRVAAAAIVPVLAVLLYLAVAYDGGDDGSLTGRVVNHFHLAAGDHEECQGIPIDGKGALKSVIPDLERILNGNEEPFRFVIAGDCDVADARFTHYIFEAESGRRLSLFLEERRPNEALPEDLLLQHVSDTPVYGTQINRHAIVCLQGADYYIYLVGDDFGQTEMVELAGKLAPPLQAAVL